MFLDVKEINHLFHLVDSSFLLVKFEIFCYSSKIAEFAADDRVFVWDGSEWLSFQKNGFGNWALASNLFGNENDTVIFPDEGMFILRSATSAIELTLFGEVPAVPQISTITKTKQNHQL